MEIGYHDNYADATWIENNRPAIAEALGKAMARYFGVPFIYPVDPSPATVRVNAGTLNLRRRPSQDAQVIGNLPNGAAVTVYGEWEGWYVVGYRNLLGYAAASYIQLG